MFLVLFCRFLAAFLLQFSFADSSVCETQLTEEKVFDQTFHIRQFKDPQFKYGYVQLSELFENPSESLFIGITGKGHVFLIAGEHRYDGNAVGITQVTDNSGSVKNNVLLLKFDSIPAEVLNSIQAFLQKKEGRGGWSLSCYHGLCSTLRRAGGIRPVEKLSWRPSKVYESLLASGVAGPSGEKLPFEIYKLGDVSIEGFRKSIQEQEQSFMKFKVGAVAVLFLGPVIIELLWDLVHT